jgi:hypothetical protein
VISTRMVSELLRPDAEQLSFSACVAAIYSADGLAGFFRYETQWLRKLFQVTSDFSFPFDHFIFALRFSLMHSVALCPRCCRSWCSRPSTPQPHKHTSAFCVQVPQLRTSALCAQIQVTRSVGQLNKSYLSRVVCIP